MRTIALLIAAVLLAGCSASAAPPTLPESVVEAPATRAPFLTDSYYDHTQFSAATAQPVNCQVDGRLRGGMVPHHLIASDMIAGFFTEAGRQHEQQPYDGILLVSPSHFPEDCGSLAVTASLPWRTMQGDVATDQPLLETLLADSIIAVEDNPDAVEHDHGVAGLAPFVARYLPDVPMTALMLSNKLPPERLRAVWAAVAKAVQQRNLLVVVSADCSHYLTPDEAEECDTQTIEAITSRNRRALLSMSDRNIDSPQSVTTLLEVADTLEGSLELLDHSSSLHKLSAPLYSLAHADGLTTYMVWGVVTA